MPLRILITSGPTREYLDPVRFLTNGSSGRMGVALAEAVLKRGGIPVVVSGQVTLNYPDGSEIYFVETTGQMLETCLKLFPDCNGIIGAAAPCDFMPEHFFEQKLSKSKSGGGQPVVFRFIETPDVLAAVGKNKRSDQWSIGFALETQNGKKNAMEKLKQKNCDFIVLNHPENINTEIAAVQVFDTQGEIRFCLTGSKTIIAEKILDLII